MSSQSMENWASIQESQLSQGCTCKQTNCQTEGSRCRGRKIVIIVANGVPDFELANLIEPLHEATRACQSCAPYWQLYVLENDSVKTASGAVLMLPNFFLNFDGDFADRTAKDHLLLLLGDFSSHQPHVVQLISLMRRGLAHGLAIGAIGDAIQLLLAEKFVWQGECALPLCMPSLSLSYTKLKFRERCFLKRGSIITCSGGSTAFDLAMALVKTHIGKKHYERMLARTLQTQVLLESESGGWSRSTRLGIRNSAICAAIKEMEKCIATGTPFKYVRENSKVSSRQLERLFRNHLNSSPTKYYLNMRLEQARPLFRSTKMPVSQVALATGFVNPSHFSKCFQSRYGRTPTEERQKFQMEFK